MPNEIIAALGTSSGMAAGTGGGAVLFALFARHLIKTYFVDRKDAAEVAAGQSLFDNLRLENKRMSELVTLMSAQLGELINDKHQLSARIAELEISVKKLVVMEEDLVARDCALSGLREQLADAKGEIASFKASAGERRAHGGIR